VWGLTLCYAAALVAICTAGILGPETMTRKVYRDVDYDNIEVPSSLNFLYLIECCVLYPTVELVSRVGPLLSLQHSGD